jgi:hypothetical protein
VNLNSHTCPGSHGIIVNKENIYETGILCTEEGYFQSAISPNWTWRGSNNTIPAGEWHFLAVNWNGDKQRHFMDGDFKLEADMGNGPSVGNTSCLRLGARGGCGGASSYFNGYLDEIRIYDRALSDTEINNIYEATK